MSTEPGSRVGVIYDGDPFTKIVEFLGYGVYSGDEVPVGAVGFMAETLLKLKHVSQKITLDSGEVVYGCECWWGGEAKAKQNIEDYKKQGYEIKVISVAEARKRMKKANEEDEKEEEETNAG